MAQEFGILSIGSGKYLPKNFRESLHSKGYQTFFVPTVAEAKDATKGLRNITLVIELGNYSSESRAKIEELKSATFLHVYPLVAVSSQGDRAEAVLSGVFPYTLSVGVPCDNQDILQAIQIIVSDYKQIVDGAFRQRLAQILPPRITYEPVKEPVAGTHPLFKAFPSISTLVFDKLVDLGLQQKYLGGIEYAHATTEDCFKDKNYLPAQSVVTKQIDEFLKGSPRYLATRLHRTAHIAHNLFKTLHLPSELEEPLKETAFLLYWSFAKGPKEYLKRDYIFASTPAFRSNLCSRIKDSAMKATTELGSASTGNLIAKVAKLIGGEEPLDDEPLTIAASVIMAADLTERACAMRGHFSPRLAYDLLRRIKMGRLLEIHPIVLCCLIKLISEAIGSTVKKWSIPKKNQKNIEETAMARKESEPELKQDEVRIAVQALSPGMRLKRPLRAYDGKLLLQEDLTLDQDLIWRIWQLSALRPLDEPVVQIPQQEASDTQP